MSFKAESFFFVFLSSSFFLRFFVGVNAGFDKISTTLIAVRLPSGTTGPLPGNFRAIVVSFLSRISKYGCLDILGSMGLEFSLQLQILISFL